MTDFNSLNVFKWRQKDATTSLHSQNFLNSDE